ncbi:F5/8 type C domain-containing protein [Anseongella ginsenosidimutans]|uniref:F5/8 type C domain-containing protein n=2 Tax=Anseongella ginsenosidimutans TaxID=496056 RepID=A0A4R3L1I0_9SPHI|nr:F5/8 type C domain-containing protein [Anseongella ginsenosidimutans]
MFLGLAGLLAGLASCSEMDDYKQYLPEGEIRYVGRADSVMVYPGKNRILFTWLLISDPNVSRCKVYWNNRGDSAEIAVQKTAGIDTIYLLLENMTERTYNFEIYTYDDEGYSSVPVFESGTVYGDKYQAVLLPRLVNEAWLREDTAVLDFAAPGNEVVGTELKYTSISGQEATFMVHPDSSQAKIADYKPGTPFQYRTLYLPDSLSIDTFYTEFLTGEVLEELDRSSWSVSGFSSEEASGEGEDNGHAIHALDDDINTFWHTQWEGAEPGPPHYLAIDAGAEVTFNGFIFTPRQGSASGNAKDIEIAVSTDGVAWEPAGTFTLENTDDRHLVFLTSPIQAKYFKVTVNASHGDQNSTFFAEVGAF